MTGLGFPLLMMRSGRLDFRHNVTQKSDRFCGLIFVLHRWVRICHRVQSRAAAVNCDTSERCPRQMKRGFVRKKQGAMRSAPSEQCDHVSDR